MSEKETPLIDLLRNVPTDARAIYEHSEFHSSSIPYGSLCFRAAERIAELEQLNRMVGYAADAYNNDSEAAHTALAAAQAQLAGAKKYIDGVRCPQCDQLRLELGEARKDAERLDWMQFHGARVAWGNDDEVCRVIWSDRDGGFYQTDLFDDWRAAIDAARGEQP